MVVVSMEDWPLNMTRLSPSILMAVMMVIESSDGVVDVDTTVYPDAVVVTVSVQPQSVR